MLNLETFEAILDGTMADEEIAACLTQSAPGGEKLQEIVLAARVLRRRSVKIEAPPGAIDVCGTGGDNSGSVNISTAVAIVTAACGVPVAKHGNRAASSRSGSADVMEALGVDLSYTPPRAEQILRETGLVFLMAPVFHPTLIRLAPIRKKIARRTIFNLLGPLLNPAGVKRQLVGVYNLALVDTIALALQELGSERAFVVHGDGMDELSLTGMNAVADLDHGEITPRTISASVFSLAPADKATLAGGSAADNAGLLLAMLKGSTGPYRDIVLLNTAAALMVADKVSALPDGIDLAAAAIDSGIALKCLETFRDATHEQ
jgi:anthranilate phosphoribosyltransferase